MATQDLTAELFYSADWHEATAYVRNPVTATWGLRDEGSGLTPARCTVTLDDRTGDYNPDDARSDLYGLIGRNTPGRVTVGTDVIADGSVSSWAPDRAVKGDAWTDIDITGPSQRVNASKSVFSALRSTILAAGPVAYWPLEDGAATTAPLSGLPGGPALTLDGSAEFQSTLTPLAPGTAGQVDLFTTQGSLAGPLTGLTSGDMQVEFVATSPVGATANFVIHVDDDDGTGHNFAVDTSVEGDGMPHHYAIYLHQNGANQEVTIYVDGVDLYGTGSAPGSVGQGVAISIGHILAASSQVVLLSHVAVFAGGFNDPAARVAALGGHAGETCADRFERLCVERGIPSSVYDGGAGSDPHTMGPQYPDTLANLLTECARTELGLIYDQRGANALELRLGRSLYNQTAALALTYGVDVAPPIRPVTDDLGIANDVTANARQGTRAHAEKLSGPNNVSDPVDDPEGIGRQEATTDVNPETSTQLANVASWGLHVGTWPGARYRQVTVDVDTHDELLADVMAIRPGDRITIDDLDADQVELLVLGGTDIIESHARRITFNCVPAGPYHVGQAETAGFDRIGSSSSTLASDFDAGTDTSMSVTIAAGGSLWDDADAPYHIKVGGVVLNVTAVAGTSSPQTFTVDATPVNGITRTVVAGNRIDVENPIYVGA